jgi:hypothetical protein
LDPYHFAQDRKLVSSKWVFKIKYNLDNNRNKYKAHLVAKGFLQIAKPRFWKNFFLDSKNKFHKNIISIRCTF